MGLDMYLERETYVKQWDHIPAHEQYSVVVTCGGKECQIDNSKVSSVTEELAYWRKANQIHNWFIQNCADGDDKRYRTYVPLEKLEQLLALCKQVKETAVLVDGLVSNGQTCGPETGGKLEMVIEDGKMIENAEEIAKLLPTRSGFFFGSTDYDQYYMQDIDRTIEQLQPIVDAGETGGSLYYEASW